MKLAGIACAGLLLLAGGAAAQDGGKATTRTAGTRISLGTATPGGGFPVYGNAFAEVMNAADPALSIEPRNTTGSSENIPLLDPASSTSRWWRASLATKPSWASAGRPPN